MPWSSRNMEAAHSWTRLPSGTSPVASPALPPRESGRGRRVGDGDTTDELIALAHGYQTTPSRGSWTSCSPPESWSHARWWRWPCVHLGHQAISLSGSQAGIRTDASHGKAKITNVDPGRLLAELDQGNIVVVAGFQGITEGLDVTTLGRGASDISAVAIAAAIEADRCEVYTDVDGIYTADPRLVPEARKMDEVGFEEMLELASSGAKMAPRSIELGMVYDVLIMVASSFQERPGTLIHRGADVDRPVGEARNRVRGIATDTNVAKITVIGVPDRPGGAARIFEPLAEADISVDIIVQSAVVDGKADLTFTVTRSDLKRAVQVVEGPARELGSGGVATTDNLAKVSIVGTGMQDAPGYASGMFRALAEADINIEVITTSEIRITCVVPESRVGDAARVLHRVFLVERPGMSGLAGFGMIAGSSPLTRWAALLTAGTSTGPVTRRPIRRYSPSSSRV